MADQLRLRVDDATVVVDPSLGGSLTSLLVRGQELLLPPTGQTSPFPMSGSFLMAPWVGHVARGRLPFRGRVHQLPTMWRGHAVHGLVADQPWSVEARSETDVALVHPLSASWPFGGSVRHEIRLAPDAIELRASVRADAMAMPAALGWHPWFLRPTTAPVRARVAAEAILEHDADELPTGALIPIDGEADLRQAPILGDRRIDVVYVQASGPCDLWLGELRLTIDFDPGMNTVVVYTPPDSICLEPWSSWPDAARLTESGYATGLVELAPGESLDRWTRWSWA
jgi:aldose 1-epimerase